MTSRVWLKDQEAWRWDCSCLFLRRSLILPHTSAPRRGNITILAAGRRHCRVLNCWRELLLPLILAQPQPRCETSTAALHIVQKCSFVVMFSAWHAHFKVNICLHSVSTLLLWQEFMCRFCKNLNCCRTFQVSLFPHVVLEAIRVYLPYSPNAPHALENGLFWSDVCSVVAASVAAGGIFMATCPQWSRIHTWLWNLIHRLIKSLLRLEL